MERYFTRQPHVFHMLTRVAAMLCHFLSKSNPKDRSFNSYIRRIAYNDAESSLFLRSYHANSITGWVSETGQQLAQYKLHAVFLRWMMVIVWIRYNAYINSATCYNFEVRSKIDMFRSESWYWVFNCYGANLAMKFESIFEWREARHLVVLLFISISKQAAKVACSATGGVRGGERL